MPIDRSQPPTNKVLLECGPGIAFVSVFEPDLCEIVIRDDNAESGITSVFRWWLELAPCESIPRGITLKAFDWDDNFYVPALVLAPVSTLGEVIALYETLSQKKWPD